MFGRSRSVGETALKTQLNIAQQRISTLEDYIHSRERQYQTTISHLHGERRESRDHYSSGVGQFISQRRRRVGRTHDIIMSMRSVGSTSFEEGNEVENENLQAPLGEFVSLKLVKALEPDEATPIPFVIRRLVGRVYHVGPEGITLGTSPHCSVILPAEAEIQKEHCQIIWRDDNDSNDDLERTETSRHLSRQRRVEDGGHFILKDLTAGTGVFYISHVTHHVTTPIEEEEIPSNEESVARERGIIGSDKFPMVLSYGIHFVTGILVWELSALSPSEVLTAKLFHLAKQRDLVQLKEQINKMESSTLNVPTLTITGTEDNEQSSIKFSIDSVFSTPILPLTSYDINTEYQPPSYEGDDKFNALFAPRKSFGITQFSLNTPSTANIRQVPRLLLHIAIDNSDIEMVTYLLSRGANVNKAAGEFQYTAVHLAALRNDDVIMTLLLKYGADVEIRNAEHLTPLAMTTNYSVRKMLLNSVLLCAAADGGDISEVTRLLTTTPISPNVKGLRHKCALHLAAAKGYREIVEFLILNGVDVNIRGGSRQRTALHYASLGGYADIIQILLSAGAHEFTRDAGGYTPLNLCQGDACRLLHTKPMSLCLAVQSGNIDQVKIILEQRECHENRDDDDDVINLRNDQTHAPLHLACILGSMDLVQLLVSYGAQVDIHGGSDSWTPLFYAAMSGHIHLVEFLLSVGANPEEEDSQGSTVRERLIKAIEETEECMTRLKQRERSASVVDTNLITRLSVNMLRQESSPSCSVENELEWQNLKLTKLKEVLSLLTTPTEKLLSALNDKNLSEFVSLLESGTISPDILLGNRPVLVQICEDGLYGFAKVLLDHGAKVCLDGAANEIPLIVAASNGDVPLLKLLIEYGANVNVQSCDTLNTALHEAASTNDIEVVNYLLSVGADITLVNISGEQSFDCTTISEIRKLLATGNNRLLVAVMEDDQTVISHLVLEEGVSVNTEYYHNGYTALHQACEEGYDEITQLLIELGADINKKGGLYLQTPLHIASQRNHLEVAKVLLKHGARVDIKDSDGQVPFEIASTNQMRKVLVEARQLHPPPPPPSSSSSDEGVESEGKLCLICMDKVINTIILPCGHQAFCIDCVTQITQCALDRQSIREVIPIFK